MLFLKNLVFTIAVPGTVTVVVPYVIVSRGIVMTPRSWGALQFLALPIVAFGALLYLWCVRDFAATGRGTPAPIDPPRQLVVRGPYQYVRNPMYWGVFAVLLGEAAYFESRLLLRYAMGFFIAAHVFVVLYEERALRARFGESYQRYRRSVGRWWPGKRYG